jgi:hypothetical protein
MIAVGDNSQAADYNQLYHFAYRVCVFICVNNLVYFENLQSKLGFTNFA